MRKLNRILVFGAAVCLGLVLIFPMWRIELAAPQYPEGLVLKIFPHKLGGDVDIINGLNHYIGMKTLHTVDFVEFTLLPYMICFFIALCLLIVWVNKVKWFNFLFFLFVTFGVIAMTDFWRWEYNYGHDLDPDAAIQIPGMAYQPPLIGFKQLLNFGAYSIPDIGGWFFIAAGGLLLLVFIIEFRIKKNSPMKNVVTALPVLLFFLAAMGCSNGPDPIKLGKDHCHFCKMTIADGKFATEILTTKGKVMKFDDMKCALDFIKSENIPETELAGVYVCDYQKPLVLIDAHEAYYIRDNNLRSPMSGNIAAFANESLRDEAAKGVNTQKLRWLDLSKE